MGEDFPWGVMGSYLKNESNFGNDSFPDIKHKSTRIISIHAALTACQQGVASPHGPDWKRVHRTVLRCGRICPAIHVAVSVAVAGKIVARGLLFYCAGSRIIWICVCRFSGFANPHTRNGRYQNCRFAQFCRDARLVRPLRNQTHILLIYKWLVVPYSTRTHGPCVPTRWVLPILIHPQWCRLSGKKYEGAA